MNALYVSPFMRRRL